MNIQHCNEERLVSTTACDDQHAPEPAAVTTYAVREEVFHKLRVKVVQWAYARNLIKGSTLQAQACKLWEEFGELSTGVNKCKMELVRDGIGDCLVVLTILQEQAAAKGVDPRTPPQLSMTLLPHREPDELASARHLLLSTAHDFANLPLLGGVLTQGEIGLASYNLQRIAYKFGTTPEACLQTAWDEIKDRKGRMIGGVFVKEADLCKQPIG